MKSIDSIGFHCATAFLIKTKTKAERQKETTAHVRGVLELTPYPPPLPQPTPLLGPMFFIIAACCYFAPENGSARFGCHMRMVCLHMHTNSSYIHT